MPGWPAMPPTPDQPGARLALVVATSTYTDPGLSRLRAPARDADDLAQVLADPGIGGFAVTTVIDQPAQQIRLAVEDFLDGRGTGDLLLVYLSCHGLLDARRRLYFAATDTRKDRLGSTGVEAGWVLDQLEHCRARRQVLILDSCFSGAFAHGAKGEADLDLRDRFLGQGRGRVVLTASNATEYSFEGDPTDASATAAGSVFTAALVQGLRTGAADTDHDGHVSVDDAYAYVFNQVQAAGAAQTPQRWLYGAEGQILLARSPTGPTIIPASLPESLQAGLDSPHPGIRIGAVTELGEWLTGGDPARAATALRLLQEVADTDIPRVAGTARVLLDTGITAEPPIPADLRASAPAPYESVQVPSPRRTSLRRNKRTASSSITAASNEPATYVATPEQEDRIFLNYRRQQSEWPTLRLRDRLIEAFGTDRIFTDVDSIEPGQHFTKALEAAVASCRVLLAVIGRDWVNARDEAGQRRLENPNDWVRIEIETALRNPKVLVIPVLLDGATMPPIDQLPGELAQLGRRQAVEITTDRFANQLETLITTLRQTLRRASH